MTGEWRRRHSGAVVLYGGVAAAAVVVTLTLVSFICLGRMMQPRLPNESSLYTHRILSPKTHQLVAATEHIRRYRSRYLKALGLPNNTTVAMLPQLLGRANLTLRENLILEPIVLQLRQWSVYESLLNELPVWIASGIDQVAKNNPSKEITGGFLRDRYVMLESGSIAAIDHLQNDAVSLRELADQSRRRIFGSFIDEGGHVNIVESLEADPSLKGLNGTSVTWIETVKQDMGQLVRQIESSGGDAFAELHKAGMAHLETVIRVPGTDEGTFHADTPSSHHNVTGHSAGSLIDPYNNWFVLARPANLAAVGEDSHLLVEVFVLILLAMTLGMLMETIAGLPSFLGYLLAGMLLGPSCLDQIQNMMQLVTLGQGCLLLIILALGLESPIEKLQAGWRISIFGTIALTLGSVLITSIAGTFIFGIQLAQSLFAGTVISLSSTVVAVKCLQASGDKAALSTLVGRTILGILVVQDLLFCVALAVLPVLGVGNGSGIIQTILLFTVKAVGYTALVLVLGRIISWLRPKLLTDPMCVLVGVLSCGLVANHVGIGSELGVFIAAMGVASNNTGAIGEDLVQRISVLSEAGGILFFASIGLLIDVRFLWGEVWLLVPLALFVVLVKAILAAISLKLLGSLEGKTALAVGLGLAQVSELALTLGARGRRLGLVTGEAYYLLAGMAALTMIFAPIIWRLAHMINVSLKKRRTSNLL